MTEGAEITAFCFDDSGESSDSSSDTMSSAELCDACSYQSARFLSFFAGPLDHIHCQWHDDDPPVPKVPCTHVSMRRECPNSLPRQELFIMMPPSVYPCCCFFWFAVFFLSNLYLLFSGLRFLDCERKGAHPYLLCARFDVLVLCVYVYVHIYIYKYIYMCVWVHFDWRVHTPEKDGE